MSRDSKFSQRNLRKSSNLDEEKENAPVNTNTIVDEEVDLKSTKFCKTPLKACKSRHLDTLLPLKTPDKQRVLADKSYGVSEKNVLGSNVSEMEVDSSRYYTNGNGGFANVITPVLSRPNGKGNLSNSTQSTPSKSVTRPPNPKLCLSGGGSGVASVCGGARMANFAALSKGVPISSSSLTVVNTIEVPHFAIKEDSNFWMDHNVQVRLCLLHCKVIFFFFVVLSEF